MVRGLKEFNEPLELINERLTNTSTYAQIDSISTQLKEYSREASTILTKLDTDSKAVDEHYSGIKAADKKRKREDDAVAAATPPAPKPVTATSSPTTSTSTPTGQSGCGI